MTHTDARMHAHTHTHIHTHKKEEKEEEEKKKKREREGKVLIKRKWTYGKLHPIVKWCYHKENQNNIKQKQQGK